MIDRVAALADIVAPSQVAQPLPGPGWHGSTGWLLGAVAVVAALGVALASARRLRRMLARRRLRRLALRLRQATADVDIAALLPAVWLDIERAGFVAARWPGSARRLRERLLYAREKSPEALRELLQQLRA